MCTTSNARPPPLPPEGWQRNLAGTASRCSRGAASKQRALLRNVTYHSHDPWIFILETKEGAATVPSTADSALVHTRTRANRKRCLAAVEPPLLLLHHLPCLALLTSVLEHDLPVSPCAPCPGALRKRRGRCCCLSPLEASLLLLRGKSVRARRSRPLGPFPLERHPIPRGGMRLLHPLAQVQAPSPAQRQQSSSTRYRA